MHNKHTRIVLVMALASLSACALNGAKSPHNDVLVFATQTKFGVDVSAPLNSATLPQFNVGYNRSEAVWMPLRPNGKPSGSQLEDERAIIDRLQDCDLRMRATIADLKDRQAICLASVLPSGKYVSMASGVTSKVGGAALEIDTYSVFASFGVRGGVSGAQANGGLAQIFATGIAAQRLASNPQVGQALNTQAVAAAVAEANFGEAKEKTKQDQLAQFGLSATEAVRGQEMVSLAQIRTVWTSCGDPASDKPKFSEIIAHAKAAQPQEPFWNFLGQAKDKEDALKRLEGMGNPVLEQFVSSRKSVCGE